jgi:hypothetical protein
MSRIRPPGPDVAGGVHDCRTQHGVFLNGRGVGLGPRAFSGGKPVFFYPLTGRSQGVVRFGAGALAWAHIRVGVNAHVGRSCGGVAACSITR